MAVLLSPVGGAAAQFLDNNGNPLLAGKLYTYVAGTTTNQAVYTSSNGVTPHTNPIILDAGGRVPGGEIWLTDGLQYKFVLKNANDVLIGTYDNLVGINSNFVNFLTETEVQTATAGQTVFTLTTMQYQQGTNNLSVFVDGVNQIDGATYSYVETSPTVVTFTTGLHVGALVKFTTAQTLSTGVTDASLVTYTPAGTGAVATNVQTKLRESLSFEDLGAVGDGVTDDGAIINAKIYARYGGLATTQSQEFVEIYGTNGKTYLFATPVTVRQNRLRFIGNGATINCTGAYAFDITQDGSGNGNEAGAIINWKITGATTAAIRGRAANFWQITDNWIINNAIGIDINAVEANIDNNYIRENSSFGVVVQSATLVGGSVGESQRCVIQNNRIWVNGSYGLYLIDGGGHFVNGNDLEVNSNTELYIRCSFGNYIGGLYAEPASPSANIIFIDNTPALAVGRFSDSNQIIGGTFGGGATNDIQIVGGNNTIIMGVRYGTGNVVIGAACSNTTLLQQATPPIVTNNGNATTDLSQIGVSKWYAGTFARIIMDASLAAGGAIGSADNSLRHYGVAGLSANQNIPRNFVGYADIADAATSSVVNFPANEPSTSYGIQLTVMDVAGTPAANSHIAYVTGRSASGFTVNLVAAPGTSNSVRVHWMIVQQ